MYIYYVYQYLRIKNSSTAQAGTPYYIGKGKDNRAYSKHGNTPVPTNKDLIQFIAHNLSESEAHQLEIKLIAQYGRKNNGTGILLNRTDGGEGNSGLIHTRETKEKLSIANKGKQLTKETRDKMTATRLGMKHTEASKIKMCEVQQNRSDETKAKMSAAKKGKIGTMTGKTHSAETKAKQRDASLQYWHKKRGN